jgi:hypothetical protein
MQRSDRDTAIAFLDEQAHEIRVLRDDRDPLVNGRPGSRAGCGGTC